MKTALSVLELARALERATDRLAASAISCASTCSPIFPRRFLGRTMQIARIGGGSVEQYPADMVGAKAANLARMAALGLPVPPAFVLPIALCAAIADGDGKALQK